MVEATKVDIKEIENLCRRHIKSSALTEEAYIYMAQLIAEDCPRNSIELWNLINDFLRDGVVYTDEDSFKVCDVLQKIFLDKHLIVVE